MIKSSLNELMPIYLQLFNAVLKLGIMPQTWCDGLITSICKSGTKSDRSNYRGICIFFCLGKFAQFSIKDFSSTFSHVTYFIESQKGFSANNRTADHVLTLRTLIDKWHLNCHKTKVNACFVDFRKAFDSLWHDGLFSLRSGRFEVVGTRKKR